MIGRLWPLDRDLAAASALALLALLVNVLPLPDPLRAAVSTPFVLLVPGYLIAAVLFPPGFVTRDERTVLTVALSVAAWGIGGLALQLVVDLDRTVWLLLGLAVTLVGVALAQARRIALEPRGARAAARPAAARSLRWPGTPTGLSLVAALLILGVAIAVASAGEARQLARAHFSGVWIVPRVEPGTELPARLEVGIQNHEGRPGHYTLLVTTNGHKIEEWDLQLDDGEVWRNSVPADDAEGPVTVRLFREGELEHRVKLEYRVPA